jgi:alcohol dehydrogenase (NADP+)
MIKAKAFAKTSPSSQFIPFEIERRSPKPDDVLIEIDFCGVCHSDIHTARGEWGPVQYPFVPGHEIVGRVIAVGKKVKKFKVGDLAGVGCMVDSCGKCGSCKTHEEQFCRNHVVYTYNSQELNGTNRTQGGYSSHITVKDKYVLKLKKGLPLKRVAPLLCAGITTYSPLKRYGTKRGSKVGVIGLGGLGHIAVKIAKAMGAEVTVFSTSEEKKNDAKKLGAKNFVLTSDLKNFTSVRETLDLIIDTASAQHDYSPYLSTLKVGGTHVLLGVPPATKLEVNSLIGGRRQLVGSLIGGIKETQQMLDFCAKHKVLADIELIAASRLNEAYDRTVQGDVKYRFVVDSKTLA